MKSEQSFRQFYDTHLREKALALNSKKTIAIFAGIFCRFYVVLFFIAITSLVLGFLNMFPFSAFAIPGIEYFFKGFFMLVLSIILIVHARKKIREDLVPKYPAFFSIKNSVLLVALIFWLIVMSGGWYVGTSFLGGEFGLAFLAKWSSSIIGLTVLAIPFRIFEKIENRFIGNYKMNLLPAIINFTGSEISYSPEKYIPKNVFEESALFPAQSIWSYKGSDYTKGKSGQTDFEFSQLHVMKKETKQSSGKTETEISELFKGIFYKADFHKNFSEKTFIVPDLAREIFGAYIGEMLNKNIGNPNRSDVKLIYTEDMEFEKLFAVFSSDEQQARYILTPSMQQKITALKSKFSNDMYFSFVNGNLYIGIESGNDFFAPNIFGNIDDYQSVEKHYLLVKNMLDIANELGLNTRIWTK